MLTPVPGIRALVPAEREDARRDVVELLQLVAGTADHDHRGLPLDSIERYGLTGALVLVEELLGLELAEYFGWNPDMPGGSTLESTRDSTSRWSPTLPLTEAEMIRTVRTSGLVCDH